MSSSGAPGEHAELSARQRLTRGRVTGRHARYGRDELVAIMRRIVRGDPRALLGMAPFERITLDEVVAAVRAGWGHAGADATTAIDPDRTIAGAAAARSRVEDVASRGGRIAFATTRPASLLPVYQSLARLAAAGGGEVLEAVETPSFRADGRARVRVRWLDGVAVLTDGASLLGATGLGAVEELLFFLPRADLVVADRGFAGGAIADRVETVAFANLDAMALGVAATRGLPVTLVPLDDERPPAAYAPLVAPDPTFSPATSSPATSLAGAG